ncbi:MAG: ThiF family adenylyltransferase [Candidatus Micrarchaeota archaeon]
MGSDEDVQDRQKRISDWQQEGISKSKILVVGAGALGNEVLKSLLQLGVSDVSIMDYDIIVKANLNRCIFFTEEDAENKRLKAEILAERARRQFPSSTVTPINGRVEDIKSDSLGGYDAIFSCLDNINARLHINAQAYGVAPLIDGGTTGFLGKVQTVKSPSSCLECSMSKKDYELLWQRYSCVGEVLDFLDPKMPAVSTTNSIVAALQVNEFLKLKMASLKNEPNLVGKYLFIDGRNGTFKTYEVQKRKECNVHQV